MRLKELSFIVGTALALVGCGHSNAVNVSTDQQIDTTRGIVGTDLIGAKGETPNDQDKIDSTVAGLCGAKVWTKNECAQHDGR